MGLIVLLLAVEIFSTVIQRIFCENTLAKRIDSSLVEIAVWGGYYVSINITTYFLIHNIWFNMAVSLVRFSLL